MTPEEITRLYNSGPDAVVGSTSRTRKSVAQGEKSITRRETKPAKSRLHDVPQTAFQRWVY